VARPGLKSTGFRALASASVLVAVDAGIALAALFAGATQNVFFTVADLTVIEFAVMLMVGGCMMARQPLNDEARYDEDGTPVLAWRAALFGRGLLLTGVLTLVLGALFVVFGFIV